MDLKHAVKIEQILEPGDEKEGEEKTREWVSYQCFKQTESVNNLTFECFEEF